MTVPKKCDVVQLDQCWCKTHVSSGGEPSKHNFTRWDQLQTPVPFAEALLPTVGSDFQCLFASLVTNRWKTVFACKLVPPITTRFAVLTDSQGWASNPQSEEDEATSLTKLSMEQDPVCAIRPMIFATRIAPDFDRHETEAAVLGCDTKSLRWGKTTTIWSSVLAPLLSILRLRPFRKRLFAKHVLCKDKSTPWAVGMRLT